MLLNANWWFQQKQQNSWYLYISFVYNKLWFTYSVIYYVKASVITNIVCILSNLDLWNANKVACFVLLTYDSYTKIRGDHLKNWDKLKFGEKADITIHCRRMHPAMFLKVNLGMVRALKNVKRTYLLDSNNKSGKTQQSCRIGAF